jgi:NADH:ubiquinone oxidoreductase subunit F (NADH-binding)
VTVAFDTGNHAAGAIARIGDDSGVLLAGPTIEQGWEILPAHRERWGDVPQLTAEQLVEALEVSGLCGRGGGQFPAARKLQTVLGQPAHRRAEAVVVVNISESEPASRKDRTIVTHRPHLLLDGAALVARALDVDDVVLYLHEDRGDAATTLSAAIAERNPAGLEDPGWRLATGPARYVAGEASAVISFVEGGPALPTWTPAPAAVAGVFGRPTFISNAETFTQIAAVALLGAQEWRTLGPDPWSGPILLTLSGSVTHPGEVVEVVGPTTIGRVLADVGGVRVPPAAVLIGGYAGTWVPGPVAWRQPLDRTGLTSAGTSIGCGLLAVLPDDACGLIETARVTSWLANEGAGQCGPCAFGLPRLGASFDALAAGSGRAVAELRKIAASVEGRGACGHPDGVVRVVRSALQTFADDVSRHRWGRTCGREDRTAVLVVPEEQS